MEQAQFTFPGVDAAFARLRRQLRAQIEALPTSPDPVAAYAAIQRELRALEAMQTFGQKTQSQLQLQSQAQEDPQPLQEPPSGTNK
jgi:hypothetical protein